MASKARTRKSPAAKTAAIRTTAARREALNDRHAQQAVDRFRTSSRGFRGVFGSHFPAKVAHVETLAYHLAQFEAHLPNAVEAIRLARYPGAGKRNPKRMALGLCENLSVLRTHLTKSIGALEHIANGRKR
jgi:hypothetical protein